MPLSNGSCHNLHFGRGRFRTKEVVGKPIRQAVVYAEFTQAGSCGTERKGSERGRHAETCPGKAGVDLPSNLVAATPAGGEVWEEGPSPCAPGEAGTFINLVSS